MRLRLAARFQAFALAGQDADLSFSRLIVDHRPRGRGGESGSHWRALQDETCAYITVMSIIGDFCFVAPEATFTNDNYDGRSEERSKQFAGVTMERGARVGANATILPGITIGRDTQVAAASVVTRHVFRLTVVCPARPVREVPAEQRLDLVTQAITVCEGT